MRDARARERGARSAGARAGRAYRGPRARRARATRALREGHATSFPAAHLAGRTLVIHAHGLYARCLIFFTLYDSKHAS